MYPPCPRLKSVLSVFSPFLLGKYSRHESLPQEPNTRLRDTFLKFLLVFTTFYLLFVDIVIHINDIVITYLTKWVTLTQVT